MHEYKNLIAKSGQTIYDSTVSESETLYIPSKNLSQMLKEGLIGLDLHGVALRTRSKVVKTRILKFLATQRQARLRKLNPAFHLRISMYISKNP